MAGSSIPRAAAVFLIISSFGMFLFISTSADAVGPSGVVEIEEDIVYLQVSPDDTGTNDIKVSVRSTETRNTVFNIVWKLDGPSTWTVMVTNNIYLCPLEKKSFTATVICPLGERADTSAELEISAVPEENGVSWEGDVSSDTCTIKVEPFYQASIIIENDFELDIPPDGSYGIKVRNDGNIRAPIGIWGENSSAFMRPSMEFLEPAENTTFEFDLDLSLDVNEYIVELSAVARDQRSDERVELVLVRDGELFHLLFRRGPFLILDGFNPTADSIPRMNVFCLGGDVTNVGLEIVDGPRGATLETEGGIDLGNLDSRYITYEIQEVTESQMLVIRAYGFDGDVKVVSNRMLVWAEGEKVESAAIPVPVVFGGGAAIATIAITGTAAYFYTASEVFKYRWLTLALVPLYSLVHDEKVLDHFFRGRLFEYVKENPGVTFTALKEHFEVNNGTLTYHLHRLEKEDLITYRNLGKYKMFYADGVRIKGVEVVISPLDKEIVEIISSEPGITSSQVIAMLRGGRSQRTISRHLKQLERKDFIDVEKFHGTRRLFLSGELERVLMPHRGVVEVAEITSVQT